MEWMERELEALAGLSLERTLRDTAPAPGRPGYVVRDGRTLLDLASNDYLGLAQYPAIAAAMRDALAVGGCLNPSAGSNADPQAFAAESANADIDLRALTAESAYSGAGSGASRLVTGNRPVFRRLEEALAAWQGSEAALVFASGYAANTGVIAALAGRGDAVFSDRLNHASIVDGAILSRAEHVRYRHNDMTHLRRMLDKHRDARRKLIVTDAVFSMDGDQAPLRELVRLKREYGAMLMVDEAHSGGVYGPRGEGLGHALGLQREIDVHMGTLGKAFGVYGAYVSGSRTLIRWLVNKARPLIYSTAPPPSVAAGALRALGLVRDGQDRRIMLAGLSARFRGALAAAGCLTIPGDSPIVPLIIGDNAAALRFSEALEGAGIAAVAIRPPTVPEGTARIRFSLSAAHSADELDDAAERIVGIGRELGVIAR